jgi:hypothetical protein
MIPESSPWAETTASPVIPSFTGCQPLFNLFFSLHYKQSSLKVHKLPLIE